jgi:hypothetical protein
MLMLARRLVVGICQFHPPAAGLKLKGVFRVSGDADEIKYLREAIESGTFFSPSPLSALHLHYGLCNLLAA